MTSRRQLVLGRRIFTSDPQRPWAEALVIDGETIAFVGDRQAGRDFAGPDAEVVDAGDGIVVPGFVDAHAHVIMTGASLLKAQLRPADNLDEIRSALLAWAAANPGSRRILGTGWRYLALDRSPHRNMLDDLFPDTPVYLEASDLHSTWVNSAALTELAIDEHTPDPIGGEIVRDPATAAATGHLQENASVLFVWPLLADVDDETRDGHLLAAVEAYSESGVTTAVDMALDPQMWASMLRLEAAGALNVRIIGHVMMLRSGDPDDELQQVAAAAAMAATSSSDRLRIAGIKIIIDGTIDGCTAALIDPYFDGRTAEPIWDLQSLIPVVTAADALGMQVALHAIGDLAVRSAIDAVEAAITTNGQRHARHRIEHLEYVDEHDVARLAALGITASMQPVHVDPSNLDNWIRMLGPSRARRGFAWREFLDAGTTLAFGTDTPTASHLPLHNMFLATTRRAPSNPQLTPHRPDFAVPLPDAVVHATRDAAWASCAESSVGMLRTGMMADMIILDRDPFDADALQLLETVVVRTLVAGRTVHPAG
jgi:predicted amidohydrolase YtcJ